MVVATASIALGGCGKPATSTPPPVVAQPPGRHAPQPSQAAPAAAAQPGSAAEPSTPSAAASGVALSPAQEAAIVSPVQAALDAFQRAKNKVPNDLNEVIAAGYLRGMPVVPAGTKIFYDPITVTVSVGPAR